MGRGTALRIAIVTALAILLTAGIGAFSMADTPRQPVRHVTLPTRPCKFEDSNNCYWDAGFMGAGGGHSYWVWKRNGKVCVRYFAAKYNRHHGHCFRP